MWIFPFMKFHMFPCFIACESVPLEWGREMGRPRNWACHCWLLGGQEQPYSLCCISIEPFYYYNWVILNKNDSVLTGQREYFLVYAFLCMMSVCQIFYLKQFSFWYRGQRTWVCLLLMRRTMKHYCCIASAQMIFIASKKVSFCRFSFVFWLVLFYMLYTPFYMFRYNYFLAGSGVFNWIGP